MFFAYTVGADQDFAGGGVDVGRDFMIGAFGLSQVVDWEIDAIMAGINGHKPAEAIRVRLMSDAEVEAIALVGCDY